MSSLFFYFGIAFVFCFFSSLVESIFEILEDYFLFLEEDSYVC